MLNFIGYLLDNFPQGSIKYYPLMYLLLESFPEEELKLLQVKFHVSKTTTHMFL